LKKYFRKQENTYQLESTTAKPVALYIKGSDTFGVMMRIMKVMSEDYKINISDLHVTSDGDHFTCEIEAMLFDMTMLGKMCMQLRNIGSVNTVNVTKIDNRLLNAEDCSCEAITKNE
jgi:(p)ppGpp synthase/HD superfamily hydrolase